MPKRNKHESGFTAVEVIIVIVVLVVIGGVGWLVYAKNHKKTTPESSSTSSSKQTASTSKLKTATKPAKTADSYAGWKSYTLPVEKLTLRYPSNWTVSNSPSSSTQDNVTLASSDGFKFYISDGASNGGDPRPQDASMPLPVTFLGQSDYFVFGYARDTNGFGFSNTQIGWGGLQTDPNDETSLPLDRTAVGPNDTTGAINAKYFRIFGNFGTSPPAMTIDQAKNNPDFKNAVLIIKSMHY